MDKEAIELLENSNVETRVFSMESTDNFFKVIEGENIGTTIKREL